MITMSEYEHLKQEREKLLNKKLRRNDTRYTVYVAILFFTVMVAFEAMRLAGRLGGAQGKRRPLSGSTDLGLGLNLSE